MLSVYEAACYQFISGRSYPGLHDVMFVRNVTDTRVQACLFETIRAIHSLGYCCVVIRGFSMSCFGLTLCRVLWVLFGRLQIR